MKVKIYAGLSLTEPEAHSVLPESRFAGPVRRGDVLGDIAAGTNVVVVIDGRFHQSLAVSVAEIVDALRCGVRVYGASSMGALRAAELNSCGMIGCGAIFDSIASQRWFRDDLLGQVFDERTLQSLTVPYVNVHFGLRALAAEGVISEQERTWVDELVRDIHFAERDAETVERAITEREPPRRRALVAAAARALAHDQKKLDALAALRTVKRELEEIALLNQRILTSQRQSADSQLFDPAIEMKVGVLLGP